jgi:YggT family protein
VCGLASAAIYEFGPRGVKGRPLERRPGLNTALPRLGPEGLPGRGGNATRHGPLARESAMRALLDVILILLDLYIYIVIAAAVLSWLVAFNVVNPRNQFVAMVGEFLYRITDPVLRPIRNMLPNMGGIDISPIVLFLIIILIQRVIVYYIYPNVF